MGVLGAQCGGSSRAVTARAPPRAGSVPSLVAGAGSGVVIMLLGVLSLKAWKTGVKGASTPYTVASAGALRVRVTRSASAYAR